MFGSFKRSKRNLITNYLKGELKMAKQVTLEQGSKEWINYRKNGIGASDIPAIINVSPYITANKLWKIKKDVIADYDISEYAKQMGESSEEDAREQFNALTGRVYVPACFEREDIPFFRCSLDGYSVDEDGTERILEAKFVGDEYFKSLQHSKTVRSDHYAQLQWQMYVMDCDTADYFVLNKHSDRQVMTVRRDNDFIETLKSHAMTFVKLLESNTEPELTDKDYLSVKDGTEVAKVMSELKSIKMGMEELAKKEKELKKALIGMAKHNKMQFQDMKFYKVEGRLTPQYKKFLEDNTIDIPNDYVKRGKPSWTFKIDRPKK
jgi:putative phage-type endonuclease